jgi:hypothetical protein
MQRNGSELNVVAVNKVKNGSKINEVNDGEMNMLKEKELKNNDNQVKSIYFLISEYGFILILGIILFLLWVIPEYHCAKTFTSKISNEPFDSNDIPKIFIHLTDIHISQYKSNRLDG